MRARSEAAPIAPPHGRAAGAPRRHGHFLLPLFAMLGVAALPLPRPDAAAHSAHPDQKEVARSADAAGPADPEARDAPGEKSGAILADVTPAEPEPAEPEPVERRLEVRRGDTLMSLVVEAGAERRDAHEAIAALAGHYDPRRLPIGQEVVVSFSPARAMPETEAESGPLLAIAIPAEADRTYIVERAVDGSFRADEIVIELASGLTRASGIIDSSLFLAARRAEVPINVVIDLIRILSFDVDFQRDIRPGDRFDVLFERLYDADGRAVKEGAISLASLELSGRKITLYRFTTEDDGRTDYYDATGSSAKKLLMKTPIDGARLTSRFGSRRHPILGYRRMHQGIDFGASRGTPIMAAGDGVVEYAGRNGSYGNYVRIRHNGQYKTAYAHMKGFARGIRRNARVIQGQIIGYVGTTGQSTGPHLHYEVLVDSRRVNPLTLKLPTGRKLGGSVLEAFERIRARIDQQFAETPLETRVASAD